MPVTWGKRLLDLLLLVFMSPVLVPVGLYLAVLMWIREGRPVFYVSERMRAPGQRFWLWKFRTMAVVDEAATVSGGAKMSRITQLGGVLRRTHADEIPQLWNVLKGDLSFVGPRPPLPEMAERFPHVYDQILQNRPGLTGMASFFFSGHEEWLLKNCGSAEETAAVYMRRCIPRKARLDLIYQRNRSIGLDLWLVWLTAAKVFRLRARRPIKRKTDGAIYD